MALGHVATNPEKSFCWGECGWANWLLVPCGSPRCEEQKSRARSGGGRPRQDRLGPHAVTTSMPLTNTSLDNLPTRDSAKPVWAQGEESGHKGAVSDQGLEPLHGCVQLHHTECFMKVCSLPNNIYQTFLCFLDWLEKNNYISCMQNNALLINKIRKLKQNRENISLLSQLLTQGSGKNIDISFNWPVLQCWASYRSNKRNHIFYWQCKLTIFKCGKIYFQLK